MARVPEVARKAICAVTATARSSLFCNYKYNCFLQFEKKVAQFSQPHSFFRYFFHNAQFITAAAQFRITVRPVATEACPQKLLCPEKFVLNR